MAKCVPSCGILAREFGTLALGGARCGGARKERIMKNGRRRRGGVVGAALMLVVVSGSGESAQRAGLPPWKALAGESKVVVVADVVKGNLWVIDSQKEAKAERAPDGTFIHAANPALYVVGIFARVRIAEVMKSDRNIKVGDTIGVLVYGYGGSDLPRDPMDKERYVFFLRPLDPKGSEFTHALIQLIDPAAPIGRSVTYKRFDPSGRYTPVEDGYGQVLVPRDKAYIVDRIKKAIAAP